MTHYHLFQSNRGLIGRHSLLWRRGLRFERVQYIAGVELIDQSLWGLNGRMKDPVLLEEKWLPILNTGSLSLARTWPNRWYYLCHRNRAWCAYFICRGSQSTPESSSLAACLTSSLSTEKLRRCSVWATATRIHSIRGGSTRNGLQGTSKV